MTDHEETTSGTAEVAGTIFYAVAVIPAVQTEEAGDVTNPIVVDDDDPFTDAESRVFVQREEALACLKSLTKRMGKDGKGSVRLKAFEGRRPAVDFASNTSTCPTKTSTSSTSSDESRETESSPSIVVTSDPPPAPTPSEGCPFKSLTPQQMKQIKEAINRGDEAAFHELTESNPRYLVTPSDTPAICHSGTRANALHVAAQSGSARMTDLVLDAIRNPDLMSAMYPDESPENRVRRQEHIFDLYLNSQLKGTFDTPLHAASKIGAIDVVATLVQFSSCDTKVRNRSNLTPADVAGTRMANPDPQLSQQIKKLLGDHVYIPVFRVADCSAPSFVGEPWSPRRLNNSDGGGDAETDQTGSDLAALSPVLIRHQLGSHGHNLDRSPVNLSVVSTPRPSHHPGGVVHSPHQPPSPLCVPSPTPLTEGEPPVPQKTVEIQALLGPLSPKQAEQVQLEWKKPKNKEERLIRLSDPSKGIERHGRQLAKRHGNDVNMIEYWEFLGGAYLDLSTPVGMEALDEHLRQMSENNHNSGQNERRQTDQDESLVLPADNSVSDLLSGFGGLKLSSDLTAIDSSTPKDHAGDDKSELEPEEKESQGPALARVKSLQAIVKEKLDNGGDSKLGSRVEELKVQPPAASHLSPNTLWNRPRVSRAAVDSPGIFGPETPFVTRQMRNRLLDGNDDEDDDDGMVTDGAVRIPDSSAFRQAATVTSDDSDGGSEKSSSFHTVCSSLESCLTAEEGQWIFMQGTVPTETDFQVYQIIRDAPVEKSTFPYLAIWKDVMSTYTDAEQCAWPKLPEKHRAMKNAGNYEAISKKLFVD